MKTIREEAQEIIDNNGHLIQCADLLKIQDEQRRGEVWREIVKIGQEQDEARDGERFDEREL